MKTLFLTCLLAVQIVEKIKVILLVLNVFAIFTHGFIFLKNETGENHLEQEVKFLNEHFCEKQKKGKEPKCASRNKIEPFLKEYKLFK